MDKNLSTKVGAILNDCNTSELTLIEKRGKSDPILYNQRDVIRRINFAINSRYVERSDDAIYWNIINPRITHFSKLISPDTKDFYPYGIGEHNYWQAWALKKKVKEWFKENEFYMLLNDISEGLGTYGSCVWKKYKEDGKLKIKEVKLDNLYFDQSVENIQDADIVEIHNLSRKDLWDKETVWDNVRKVLDKNKGDGRIEVWEYYGMYQEDDDTDPVYKHEIGQGYGEEYIKLWEEEITRDECAYEDFHLGRFRGTWLRIGIPQRLFKLQERCNQLVNQNAATTEIASLLLLQSDNGDVTGNVLEQAISGQIVGDPTLKQLLLQNPGLSQFINEMQMISQQADKLCLTPEIVQGESSPSNTTFRGIAVVNAGAVSAFKNYRQNLFEKIAAILLRDIFPSLVSKWGKLEQIEMAEDDEDIEAYDKSVVDYMKLQHLLEGKGTVTEDVVSQISDNVTNNIAKVGRKIEVDKKFWNFKWGFKLVPTDDTVDKTALNDTYFNSIQLVLQSQGMVVDMPIFKQYLEDNGISPFKLTPAQKQSLQQQPTAGATPPMKQPDKMLASANAIN